MKNKKKNFQNSFFPVPGIFLFFVPIDLCREGGILVGILFCNKWDNPNQQKNVANVVLVAGTSERKSERG